MTTTLDVPSLAAQLQSFGPRPSLPDWMEQEIVLPRNFGRPGPLRLDPWQRQIAAHVTDPRVNHMTLQLPSQTFKSLFVSGTVMYAAVHDIPAILAFPTGKLKDRWVQTKLERFAASCPAFERAIKRTNQRTIPDDGIHLRSGGMIPFALGGGEGQMQQVEASLIMVDELDTFGDDPTDLLEQRGESMPWYQVIAVGTPSLEGDSLIEYRYGLSNQSRIHVTCPECGEDTPLEYQHDYPDAVWCQSCGTALEDDHQTATLATARWEAQTPEVRERLGFQTSLLVNSVSRWSNTLAKRLWMKPEGYTTQVLAEAFSAEVDTPPRAEDMEGVFRPVPEEWTRLGRPARMLIVDVQRRQGGSLVICRIDVYGTEAEPRLAILWQRELFKTDRDWLALFQDLRKVYAEERPDLMFVDCGDYATVSVIDYVEQLFKLECERGVVRHIRGDGQRHSRFWGTDPDIKNGWTIEDAAHRDKTLVLNVGGIKSRVMFMLHDDRVILPTPQADPPRNPYPRNILEQLTAEKLVHKEARGEPRQAWVKVSKGRQNETWDCCVYALAGLSYLGPNYRSLHNATLNPERAAALWGGEQGPVVARDTGDEERPRQRRVDLYLGGA